MSREVESGEEESKEPIKSDNEVLNSLIQKLKNKESDLSIEIGKLKSKLKNSH